MNERTIFRTLEEKIQPRHTALVVLDVQNDFCSPGGSADKQGRDISASQAALPPLLDLLSAARQAGCLVIFVQVTRHPLGLTDSASRLSYFDSLHAGRPRVPSVVEGSWGWQLVDGLDPQPNEVRVQKFRTSAFINTGLDVYLRANERRSLILTGGATDGAVLATALDGSYNDYYVVVAEDCVASDHANLHDAALTLLRARFDVVPGARIASAWGK
ncbi:MAG: cysteine hydrolase [Chloroflexi bacterium]|nr:cysteine hydrolase [Chloroflexota bacterium]